MLDAEKARSIIASGNTWSLTGILICTFKRKQQSLHVFHLNDKANTAQMVMIEMI